jgi:hypothetical protein
VGNFDPPPLGDDAGTVPLISDDVGNRPRGAYRIQVGAGGMALGSQIERPRDRDWYVFRATRNGRVAVDVTTPDSDLNPMVVVKQGRKTVARNGRYGGTVDNHVEFEVKRGRQYRIMVRGLRGTSGSYLLQAEYLRNGRPGDERGVKRLEAVEFEGRQMHFGGGRIDRARDVDIFQFSVATSGTYRISIENNTAAFDSVLTLIGRNGGVLKRLKTAENGGELDELLVALKPGTYRLKVRGHAGLRGDYELAVDQVLGGLV